MMPNDATALASYLLAAGVKALDWDRRHNPPRA